MQWPDAKWLDFEEALAEGRKQRKPVLLCLSAPWCSSDPSPILSAAGRLDLEGRDVLGEIARQFVLARVDIERRPDVHRRFGRAEIPAAYLLGPDGFVLVGGNADGRGQGGAACAGRGAPPAAARGAGPGPTDLRTVLGMVEAELLLSFDEVHGGFGVAPKHPEPDALSYAVERYRRSESQRWQDVFTLTFDGITQGLFDTREGGFWRSAGRRDWQEPETAKLLGVNAGLIRAYVLAYEATQRTGYFDIADRALRSVLQRLRGNTAAFYGSLADGRVDRTIYLPPNEEMIVALLTAARITGEARYAEIAAEAQRFVLERMFDPSRGFAHYFDGSARLHGLLVDNAAALVGFARTYALAPERDYLAAATRAADLILDAHLGGESVFSETRQPDLDFEDATLAAEGLLTLGRVVGSTKYCDVARRLVALLSASVSGQRAGAVARLGSLVQELLDRENDLSRGSDVTSDGRRGGGAAR